MAYYDEYSGQEVLTPEEEEERKKKAAEEAAKKAGNTPVATTERTVYEDGSQTHTTTKEIPAPSFGERLGNAVSQAGTNFVNNIKNAPENFSRNLQQGVNRITAPVNPDEVYGRMLQAESGNRDFDNQGRPITSPKGAMFRAQVMPSTAANPGYGIRPAQSQTPEEYNRVGKDYMDAMRRQFPDNERAAAAAYNAGPGRVQRNMQANQGQLNEAQLPRETQGYLGKVFPSNQNRVVPVTPQQVQQAQQQEQQQEQPEAQAAPQPQSPYSLATGMGGQGFRAPGIMPGQPAPEIDQTKVAIGRYQQAQNDPISLIQLRSDETQPSWIRERAGNRVAEMITSENNKKAAEEALPKMTPNELAKVAVKKSEGNSVGDWLQYLLFKHVGLTDLANEKGEALGIGHKWEGVTAENGQSGMVRFGATGRPLEGIKDDGQAMSQQELISFASAGGKKATKPDVSLQDVEATINGQSVKGRVVTTYDKNQKPTTRVESGGKYYDYNGNWKPVSIGTAAEKAEQSAAVKLRYAGPTSYTEAGAKAAGEFNFNNGTNIGYASQAPGSPLVDLNTGRLVKQDANGVIQATQSGTPGAAPAPVGNVSTGRQTPADILSARERQKAEEKVTREVGEAEQKKFLESKQAIGESSNGGQAIGNARRQQLDLIKNNPSILNIMNGTGTQFDQARNIITRIATGAYSDDNKEALYVDIKNSGMGQAEQAALRDFANLNTGINAKTLKANSGAGSISNAEQQANKDANIGNVDRIPAYASLAGLHRSQFSGDLAASKQLFLDKNPQFKTDSQFNTAWQKEESNLLKGYQGIAKARFEVMGKPPAADASKEALAAYKDRVFRAFEAYPAPQFDSNTGTWNYQTANAKRAAMKQILGQ